MLQDVCTTNKIWLAYDAATGQCLTAEAVEVNDIGKLMRERPPGTTRTKTVATHEPGKSVDPKTLSWL